MSAKVNRRIRRQRELLAAGREAKAAIERATELSMELVAKNTECTNARRDLERAEYERDASRRLLVAKEAEVERLNATCEGLRDLVRERDVAIEAGIAELDAAKRTIERLNVEDRDAKKLRRRLEEAKKTIAEFQTWMHRSKRYISALETQVSQKERARAVAEVKVAEAIAEVQQPEPA